MSVPSLIGCFDDCVFVTVFWLEILNQFAFFCQLIWLNLCGLKCAAVPGALDDRASWAGIFHTIFIILEPLVTTSVILHFWSELNFFFFWPCFTELPHSPVCAYGECFPENYIWQTLHPFLHGISSICFTFHLNAPNREVVRIRLWCGSTVTIKYLWTSKFLKSFTNNIDCQLYV